MSDQIWVCRKDDQVIPEDLARQGDEWNEARCCHPAAPEDWPSRRKGHENCGPHFPVDEATPVVRMGGLSPAFYLADDDDEPDAYLIPVPEE